MMSGHYSFTSCFAPFIESMITEKETQASSMNMQNGFFTNLMNSVIRNRLKLL